MNKLNHHLRQYRHNNNDVLIHGYEEKGTEAFVSCLESEIAELKKLADHWVANHKEVVKKLKQFTCRPDITINKQQAEIADQKRKLDDKVKLIQFTDKANSKMSQEIAELKKQVADLTLVNAGVNSRLTKSVDLHNAVAVENNELKAQVELLKNKLGDVVLSEQNNSGYEPSLSCFQREITEASILLAKTPRQCLASVKADAEKKGYWQGFETASIWPGENILSHYNEWLRLKIANEIHASKIREGANES